VAGDGALWQPIGCRFEERFVRTVDSTANPVQNTGDDKNLLLNLPQKILGDRRLIGDLANSG
jgi:hypothetical protein